MAKIDRSTNPDDIGWKSISLVLVLASGAGMLPESHPGREVGVALFFCASDKPCAWIGVARLPMLPRGAIRKVHCLVVARSRVGLS